MAMRKNTVNIAFIGSGRVANWQAKFFEEGIDGANVAVT